MISFIVIAVLVIALICMVFEGSVSLTIGSDFVHDHSRSLLLDELREARLNPLDDEILNLAGGPMKGRFIADSCHSIRSRYYMYDRSDNKYRISRFSKCHQDIKECFERLKINNKPKPKY